jgi:creatinine amidohydrolase
MAFWSKRATGGTTADVPLTAPPSEGHGILRRGLAFAGVGVLGAFAGVTLRPARALPMSPEITDMTWMDVRDAVARGVTTVIVPSGGLEQNGPHMIIGKHDYIVRWAANRIAGELTNTLVTPVVSYVPEGDYEPATMNMVLPGTLGVPVPVFEAVLEGIARSLKHAGFKTICMIADHGPSVAPQGRVAARLTAEWRDAGVRVLGVDSYYADAAETAYLTSQGDTPETMGGHASISDTSELMAVHPAGVDLARLPLLAITLRAEGSGGDPSRSTIARGDAMMALKVAAAVKQIRAGMQSVQG